MKLRSKVLSAVIAGIMAITAFVGVLPKIASYTGSEMTVSAADTFVPRTTEPSRSDPNYTTGNVFYISDAGMPNCTCYAYGRAKEILGHEPSLCHGWAYQWYSYNDGYARGKEPKLGAIACWNHSGGGHVAVVEKIDGDTIWLSESSWGGDYFKYYSLNKNNMGDCGNPGGYFQGYIYIGDWANGSGGETLKSGAGRTIPDGDYWIVSALDQRDFLDIVGNEKAAAGTNVQTFVWKDKMPTQYDVWTVTYKKDGFYELSQKGTDKCLDVTDSSLEKGANLQLWTRNDFPCQRWSIGMDDKGYYLQAQCGGWFMDIDDNTVADGQNVLLWEGHGLNNQRWSFIPYNPKQTVSDGLYRIHSAKGESYLLDANGPVGDGYKAGTNIKVWDSTGDDIFKVTYDKDGYYYISEVTSGLVLGVNVNADYLSRNLNIELSSKTDGRNKKWAFLPGSNGEYYIISQLSGYCMDLNQSDNGKYEYGNNVTQYGYNGYPNQRWTLEPVTEAVQGDVTGDKKFNSTDAVQLKKFLLGMITLKAPENADMNGDGKLNVFDLIIMKRKLIA